MGTFLDVHDRQDKYCIKKNIFLDGEIICDKKEIYNMQNYGWTTWWIVCKMINETSRLTSFNEEGFGLVADCLPTSIKENCDSSHHKHMIDNGKEYYPYTNKKRSHIECIRELCSNWKRRSWLGDEMKEVCVQTL
uniref:Uncharacterized protein n=1 Tax=Cucumis melo TaxID=3656 RepID=A0A9I9E5U4_CUCME